MKSIENGFIEKQFSVKNQFWQGSFILAWILDTTGAFARNKNRHLALKGRAARFKDDSLPREEAPLPQEWPATDQKG